MKYIIIAILSVLSISAMGQIEPYQIVNDVDGEHRILMTDSTGEYVRVSLLDALSDSLEFNKTKIPVLTHLPYWQYVLPSTTNGIKCGIGINIHSSIDTTVTFQMLISASTSYFINRSFIPSGFNDIKDTPYLFIDSTDTEMAINVSTSSFSLITLTLDTNLDYFIGLQGDSPSSVGGGSATFQVVSNDDLVSVPNVTYNFVDGSNYEQPFVNNDYNEVIGTDSDINTGGSYVVDQVFMTDGVVTSHTTRQLFQLESEDDRDLAPEDIEYSEDVKTYFTSKNGLDTGNSQNSDYQDAIVFNTWIDGSGGDANLLSFDKSEKKIYHYQADQASTNWGTPEVIAYVSDIPASGGKFVDGTDTDDAVYMDGKVGIGTNAPSAGLHVLAPSVDLAIFEDNYGGTAPAIVLDNLNGGASAGGRLSFRDSGTERAYMEYQKGTGTTPSIRLGAGGSEVMRIKSDGKVGIGTNAPSTLLHLKSSGIPTIRIEDEDLSGGYSNLEVNGSALFFESYDEDGTEGQILFKNASNEAMRIKEDGNVGIGTIDPSTELSVNGAYSGEYPKNSGLSNVVFGTPNLSVHTTGYNNFIAGEYNARLSTTNWRNLIVGQSNYRNASNIQYSTASGLSNNINNTSGVSYCSLFGRENLEEAQNLGYTFASGYQNANDVTSASYSFFSGYRNAYNSTAATQYNTFIGRENAVGAADINYSVFLGYRNNYSGNNSDIDYSFISGYKNAHSAGAMATTNILGIFNAYTTTNSLNYFTAIGRENAYYPTVPMNNTILLGYRQAYNVGSEGAAAYRLAIGMYEDNPLIYGEFDNEVLKVNGNLTVTDRAGTATKSAFFDANGMLVEGDIPTQTELTGISANIVLPSAYLGEDDTYFNAVVDFNITSGWETGDEVLIYVFGPTSGDFDTSADYLFVGNNQHYVNNADFTVTTFVTGLILSYDDRYGAFGFKDNYNMSSDQQVNIQINHKDSSGNVKSSQSFQKRLNTASASNRTSTVDKSVITAPLPFNVVMKAPIISTSDRDVAALSDVSTDHGKIIYNSTTEDVEFWDGTDWVSTSSSTGGGIDSSLSKVDQNIIAADTRVVDVDGKLIMRAGETSSTGIIVSASSTISGNKYSGLNVNSSSSSSDGFYAIETEGIRIRVGDEDEGRILYSNSSSGDAVWGQADNVGRITTTLSLWSDERQVLLAGTAYGSFSAFTFPPSGWTTSQQHDGDVLTLINRSGGTRQLTGDIESTTSTTVDVLDDDTIRLVYYSSGDYWIVLSNN